MRIIAISDNHDQNLSTKFTVPDGDVLVHVGDICAVGDKPSRFIRAAHNLRRLPHKHKLYVPGNHDRYMWGDTENVGIIRKIMYDADPRIEVLFDEGITIDDISFWGSGWLQPSIGMYGEYWGDFQELWDKAPTGVDVLLSHSPPYDIMDTSGPDSPIPGDRIGSTVIYWEVFRRIRPRFHVFGHNHSGHGVKEIDGITFVNASLCDDLNRPCYEPIIFDINK